MTTEDQSTITVTLQFGQGKAYGNRLAIDPGLEPHEYAKQVAEKVERTILRHAWAGESLQEIVPEPVTEPDSSAIDDKIDDKIHEIIVTEEGESA